MSRNDVVTVTHPVTGKPVRMVRWLVEAAGVWLPSNAGELTDSQVVAVFDELTVTENAA